MLLDGRVAAITGGASGIGRATALRLASEGARVAVLDTNAGLAGEVLAELREAGAHDPLFSEVDVRDGDSVDAAFAEIERHAGPTDVLVTSAGVRTLSDPLELDRDVWEREIGVNLTGTFFCAQAAARQMVASGRGGSIITISSTAGILAYENRPAYCASKFGVVGITKSLARDLGSRGVRANCICPGLMRTPFTEPFFADEALVRNLPVVVPVGTAGTPDVVADGALFLASDLARYVTGVVLPIDGGHSTSATFNISGDDASPFSASHPR